MSDLTQNEVAVFNAARRLAGHERTAYLDAACAGNAAMRHRLDELLRVDEAAGDFLEKPARSDATALEMLSESVRSSLPTSEKPGDRIGPYKLLQKIGEGGCGVVYMAEQAEPIRRKVALKVIKLGMDTKNVIARFEAERQALALMDHPNIAKVLDAGATETGRPYFVMELVRGIKITDYCDQQRFSTHRRLELFIQICQAVQHAHQKGIIHRDLKPSNILVTEQDGAPVPKVIDFGIAKATGEQRLTDKTVFTAFEQFIGTPAYMSPEQAGLGGLDVDTRSDIYSLGVLLYELLAGRPPFDSEQLRRSALDEILKTIRETEPPRPSTKLSTLTRLEMTAVAEQRQVEPEKLHGLLRGDLDWIVMKSLEKNRARRYETANGLASDIRRHLNTEPVLARPPSRLYEFQKTVRRHKVGFAAMAAVIACLMFGLAVATWGFLKEREARRDLESVRVREHALLLHSEAKEFISEATLLYRDGQFEQAEKLLNKISPIAIERDSAHAMMRRRLSWWHAIHEEWDQSAFNFNILEKVDTLDDWNWRTVDHQMHSVLLVQQGDGAAYENLRLKTLNEFLQTTNRTIAERVCRTCLLLPADAEFVKRLDRFYELVTEEQKEQADLRINLGVKKWTAFAMAIVDYRRGDYLTTIAHCQECLAPKAFDHMAYFSVPAAQALLAMSDYRLGRGEEARIALAEARKDDLADLVHDSGSDSDWGTDPLFDCLYGQILTREAGILIEGHPSGDRRYYPTGETCLGDLLYGGAPAIGGASTANRREGVKWLRKAVEHGCDEALNSLAWGLATCTDAEIRDGTNAVRYAEQAVAATSRTNTMNLDTLAAAYAESGQFTNAVRVQKEAIRLLIQPKDIDDYTTRLRLYETNTPYRQP